MKRGTENLLKFKHLMRDLDLPEYATLGLLQSLWMKVDINCPRGNIGRYSNEDIALLVDWRGDPDLLISALVRRGWLDEHDEHRLIIHDWPEHCEDTTHRKLARAREYFADGSRPKTNRMGKEQAEIDVFYDEDQHNSAETKPVCARRAHADEKNSTPCAPTVTDTEAVTEAEPLPSRTVAERRPVGAVRAAISSIGTGSDGRQYRQTLWKRTRNAVIRGPGDPEDGRDPPDREDWWREVSRSVVNADGMQFLEETVKYIEDCADPSIRRSKDLGELAKPAAYLTWKCREFLASKGMRLPARTSKAS